MRKIKFKERVLALLLAIALVVSGVVPVPGDTAKAADAVTVRFELENKAGDFSVKVFDTNVSTEDPITNKSTENEQNYVECLLDANISYKYVISKIGYVDYEGTVEVEEESITHIVPIASERNSDGMTLEPINLSAKSIDLVAGESKTITINNKATDVEYTWESSNNKIATVKDGKITAVGCDGNKNSAEITVIGPDGKTKETIEVKVSKLDTKVKLALTPNEENDATSIEVKAFGLPDDATGKVSFYADDIFFAEVNVSNGEAVTTYAKNIIGSIKFQAVYSGNNKYNNSEVTAAGSYTKTTPLEFKDEDAEKVLSAEEKFEIEVKKTEVDGRILSFESDNTSVATVDNDGNVTAIAPGKAIITVKATAGDDYVEATKEFTVIVKKVVNVNTIGWATTSRVYDGTEKATLVGTLSADDAATYGFTEVKVTYDATVDGKDIGIYSATLDKLVSVKVEENDVNKYYDFTIDENYKAENKVEITKRTVYLRTEDVSGIKYDEDVKSVIEEKTGLVYEDFSLKTSETGMVSNDVIEITKATIAEKVYAPEVTHENVIEPVIVNKDDSNYTYEITTNEEHLGDLTLEKAALGNSIYEVFTWSSTSNTHYQTEDDKSAIWFQEGNLQAIINDAYKTLYDSVVFVTEGDNKNNLSTDGYTVGDSYIIENISGNLYLAKDGKQVTDSVNFTIKIDKTNPIVKLEGWMESANVLETLENAIKFEKYTESDYSVEAVVTDGGSGLKEWYYCVYKVEEVVGEDGSITQTIDDQLEKEALDAKISENAFTWTKGSEEDIPVVTGISKNAEEYQGYYIVLIKAVDNVKNSVIYASNGVVIDCKEPVITISDVGGKPIDSTKYNSADVEYKVTVTDPIGTTSGLENVVIEILDEKETISVVKDTISVVKDTISVVKDTGSLYSQADLESLSSKEYEGSVDALYDSNNIKIVVTAYDQAGKEAKKAEQPLIIDSTKPTINVSFDNNSAKNGKYFNEDRTMTIVYTEKNIDKENGITFDVLSGIGIDSSNPVKAVKLSDLGNYGITYEWTEDTEGTKNVATYTNERKNTLVLTFNKDNEYYIVPHCTDLADNTESAIEYTEGTVCEKEFIIDKTAPVANVEYTNNLFATATAEENRVYSNVDVTATVTIEEQNFVQDEVFSNDPQQMNIVSTGIDYDGEEVEIEKHQEVANNTGNWQQNGNVYTATFDFKTDANYTFGFTYTDLAGNPVVYENRYFTVDKTQPDGAILVDEQDVWETVWNIITFNFFKNDAYKVKLTAEDTTAGVKSVAYFKTSKALNKDADMTKLDWKEDDEFTVEPDEQFVLYAKIVDKAGNIRYLYPENGSVTEDNAPIVNVVETSSPTNGKGIYNTTIPLKVTVTDVDNDDVMNSGIEKIWYVITADVNGEKISEEKTLYDKKSDVVEGTNIKLEQGEETVDCTFDVSEKFNSNNIHVTVYALDVAGTQSMDEIDLKMDTVDPTVSITYDLNAPLNGKYYNKTRTATVTVTERNFDPNNVRFTITNTDGTKAQIGNWNVDNSGKYDSATNTCKVVFSADGDYTMTFNCTDLAGNTSNYSKVDEFTIDKTKPIINVSYDNNNVENGSYYDAVRTATVTITEHNFRASDVEFETNGKVNGWKSSGDKHTATVYFGSDNDYYFDVSYIDLAGNEADDYTRDEFTVDLTNPTVEITGVKDRSANKGTVAPVITIHDTNFKYNGVEYTLVGANKGKINISGMISVSRTSDGCVIRFNNFPEGMDDIYTLTATSVDMAGNKTTKEILYSVNRDGSTYKVNKYTKELIEKGYTNDPQDIVIEETNVDTLTFIELSYTKDGKIVVLEEGKDYKVSTVGGENSWKKYTYTIFASAFEEEGKYNINIKSKDRAKNESNNKVQSMTVEFVVDKTVPTMAISNLEDRGRYDTETHQFIINVKDNALLSKVEIYMENENGELELVNTIEGEDLLVENGKLYIDVPSKEGYQKVKVVAYDEAGNATDPAEFEYSVLVTTNGWLLFYNNTPLFVGTIVGVLAVLGFIFFLIWKKRKKDEEAA